MWNYFKRNSYTFRTHYSGESRSCILAFPHTRTHSLIAVDNQRKRAGQRLLAGWLPTTATEVAEQAARQCPGRALALSRGLAAVRFVYATIKIRNERDCKLKEIKKYVTCAGCWFGLLCPCVCAE